MKFSNSNPTLIYGEAQLPALRKKVSTLILLLFSVCTRSLPAQEMDIEKIYSARFQRDEDKNQDQQPDNWQRRVDRLHPAYLGIRMVSRDATVARDVAAAQKTLVQLMRAWETGRWDPNYIPETTPAELAEILDKTVLENCLEIQMDGGAAELIGPKFPMDQRFSYQLQAEVSCDNLNGHRAWVELQLLDEHEKQIDSLGTSPATGHLPWQTYSSLAETVPQPNLRWGRIHVRVEPYEFTKPSGIARFDNICIYRIPRLALSTELPFNVASPNKPVNIRCDAMGIKRHGGQVFFEIQDVQGDLVRRETVPLTTQSEQIPKQYLISKSPAGLLPQAKPAEAYSGMATWQVVFPEPGLYRINVNLGEGQVRAQRRALLIAVMDDPLVVDAGPFGWSVPEFGPSLSMVDLPELVKRFGAGWVKYPVWFDMLNADEADELVFLTERLQLFNVQCVGRLDGPPRSQRNSFSASAADELYAAGVYRETATWEPLLEPVLTRMGMKLQWFQLGRDQDQSFIGDADLVKLISGIRARMQNYSQELKLAIAWNWLAVPPPAEGGIPWNSLHYSTAPALTSRELADYAEANRASQQETWININPLPASKYSLQDRVRDLTERMVEVRKNKISAAFISDPQDPEQGLFREGTKIGELAIPWRHLVACLGAGEFVGSIEMPNGSTNYVFGSGKNGVMLTWNERPTSEQLFLGNNVSGIDVWGRAIAVEQVANVAGWPEQKFQLQNWPCILRGVNIDVVRWRQGFQVELKNLASRLGGADTLPLVIESPFNQSVTGTMTLQSETLLAGGAVRMPLQLTNGRRHKRDLPIALRTDASAGTHRLTFNFQIDADENYKFSVLRDITLGMGDVQILWTPIRKNPRQVALHIEVTNNTSETLKFDCKLFPPGRAYERFAILDLVPGTTEKEIIVNVSDQGQKQEHWIRCEGIGSNQILNYRVEI